MMGGTRRVGGRMERRNDFRAPISCWTLDPLVPEEQAYGEFAGAPEAFDYTEVIN
jgi:hypothetical protein